MGQIESTGNKDQSALQIGAKELEAASGKQRNETTCQDLAIDGNSIVQACKRIEGCAHVTPTMTNQTIEDMVVRNISKTFLTVNNFLVDPAEREIKVSFKCENLQKIGAFKFRGATNAVKAILEEKMDESKNDITLDQARDKIGAQQVQLLQQHMQKLHSGISLKDQQAAIKEYHKVNKILVVLLKSIESAETEKDQNAALKQYKEFCEELNNPSFVTESSGNHGQALALACKMNKCKATIVMPKDAPRAKIDAVRGYGAEVVLVEPDQRKEQTEKIVKTTGATLVHPSNEPLVMSGQGTSFVEFWIQNKTQLNRELDLVIVPVGGGGLLSGVAVAAKLLNPRIVVIAAEPEQADDAYRSFKCGKLQGHKDGVPQTIASGLRTTLGSNTWPVTRKLVDDILLVSEDEIANAMKLVMERAKLVVEPSGAVALAAALSPQFRKVIQNHTNVKTIGIFLSGGNVTLDEPLPFQQK